MMHSATLLLALLGSFVFALEEARYFERNQPTNILSPTHTCRPSSVQSIEVALASYAACPTTSASACICDAYSIYTQAYIQGGCAMPTLITPSEQVQLDNLVSQVSSYNGCQATPAPRNTGLIVASAVASALDTTSAKAVNSTKAPTSTISNSTSSTSTSSSLSSSNTTSDAHITLPSILLLAISFITSFI